MGADYLCYPWLAPPTGRTPNRGQNGLWLPRGYAWLVSQQVTRVTRAARRGNPAARVLFGIPTYGRAGLSHHAPAENVRVALLGVRAGAAELEPAASTMAGVALFADYTTQPGEWATYRRLWLERE